jgi:hypothetical protein
MPCSPKILELPRFYGSEAAILFWVQLEVAMHKWKVGNSSRPKAKHAISQTCSAPESVFTKTGLKIKIKEGLRASETSRVPRQVDNNAFEVPTKSTGPRKWV